MLKCTWYQQHFFRKYEPWGWVTNVKLYEALATRLKIRLESLNWVQSFEVPSSTHSRFSSWRSTQGVVHTVKILAPARILCTGVSLPHSLPHRGIIARIGRYDLGLILLAKVQLFINFQVTYKLNYRPSGGLELQSSLQLEQMPYLIVNTVFYMGQYMYSLPLTSRLWGFLNVVYAARWTWPW